MTSSEPRAGKPGGLWTVTAWAAVGFLILCGLGTWQIYRLRWKEGLLARIAALQHAPARPLEPVMAEAAAGRDVAFTRVSATCLGLARAPFLRLYSLHDGEPGDRLMSACRLPDGRAILVDRGFLADGVSAPRVDAASRVPLQVTGVLRAPDPRSPFTPAHRPGGRWFARELPAMAHELSVAAPASYYLSVETRTNPDEPALQPAPVPTNIPNNHLGYVITWFGMALALAGVWAGFVRQRLRAGRP